MAECIQCGKFTKYNGGLCFDCYQNKDELIGTEKKSNKIEEQESKKDSSWVHNLIKGRIAETIISELFLSLGFQVFKYGMENTIPGIMELLKGVKDDVAMEIKRMPDFVVYKDSRAHFIEVKFRAA